MRRILAVLIAVPLLLAGCGGGGSTITTTTTGTTSTTGTTTSTGTTTTGSTTANVQAAIVDQGPAALLAAGIVAANILYTTVTICQPGSATNCQTIDHVQVDTGSSGLRILSTVLNSSLDLPQQTLNGAALAECTQFVDGNSWGPIVAADMYIGGTGLPGGGAEVAASVPVQVIGASTYTEPDDCLGNNVTTENTVATFGANGLIGVGPFEQDCGPGCAATTDNGFYYTCSSSTSCQQAAVPETQQLDNPIMQFATDNNGLIIQLPSVPAGGSATVTGSLIFGIGTETNNALASSATVLAVNDDTGYVGASFMDETLPDSYLDSGSNALYFDDQNLAQCSSSGIAPGFFCPTSTTSLTAAVIGANGNSATYNFSVESAETLFNDEPTYAAFSTLAGPADDETDPADFTTFAFGLPFFYGNTVYTAIELHDTSGGEGPYYAY